MIHSATVLALSALTLVTADIYIHNPRGSNNRLDGKNRDRDNANRLFDSQNNNRGGANVGTLYYHVGSTLQWEWSAQHGCGHPNSNCEMVVQAMCDERVRDGTTTTTIPDKPKDCYNYDCDTDVRFGRHESFDYYQNCKYRQRNKGLFTSSQQLKGDRAIYTRQNPNGARRGYECPEERDYYPYWHPTPWKDLAIFTNQESRCDAYKAASQNVATRSYCKVQIASFRRWHDNLKNNQNENLIPLEMAACQALNYEDANSNSTERKYGQWITAKSHGIDPPECFGNVKSRDNHHGNTETGQWTGFTWTVPDWMTSEQCVFRLRYNISTEDFPGFSGEAVLDAGEMNATLSRGYRTKGKAAKFELAERFGLESVDDNGETTNSRGYLLENNPQVDFMGNGVKLQLAVNTAQLGRTFEDRTHKMAVRAQPTETVGSRIHNINVRGKRGNIVQTYPGTEYDFTPNKVVCAKGEYVHFQWTGSNTNPNNNAGQGREGSDRSNVVTLRAQNPLHPEPTRNLGATWGQLGNSYPAHITAMPFLGLSDMERQHLAILDNNQMGGENSELDDRGVYFDMGVKQCSENGVFNYLCTRNNNFSNRSQKGAVTVSGASQSSMIASQSQHSFQFPTGSLTTADLPEPKVIEILTTADPERAEDSDLVTLNFDGVITGEAKLSLAYAQKGLADPVMMYSTGPDGPWTEVANVAIDAGVATASVSQPGYYKVDNPLNGGKVFGIVLLVLVLIGGVVGIYLYKKKQGGAPYNTQS